MVSFSIIFAFVLSAASTLAFPIPIKDFATHELLQRDSNSNLEILDQHAELFKRSPFFYGEGGSAYKGEVIGAPPRPTYTNPYAKLRRPPASKLPRPPVPHRNPRKTV